jgi:transposase
MRKLQVISPKRSRRLIQQEIARSEEARYDHRLHALLMVSQNLSCRRVAEWLGQDSSTVERWVRRFNAGGCDALREGHHTGRRGRLGASEWNETRAALRRNPREFGYAQNLWDGKLLAHHLRLNHGITLGVRQCQRMFHAMELRLRKPRAEIAKGDPELQAAYKKTPRDAER